MKILCPVGNGYLNLRKSQMKGYKLFLSASVTPSSELLICKEIEYLFFLCSSKIMKNSCTCKHSHVITTPADTK